ncbi:MAG: ArnT family glycosyltransferase [Desulfobaccales bacterium]
MITSNKPKPIIFNSWMNYILIFTSLLLFLLALLLLFLPQDSLIYIIRLTAYIFKEDNIINISNTINNVYRVSNILIILGIGSLLMAALLSFLIYLDGQRIEITSSPQNIIENLFNIKDALLVIYLVSFFCLILPALTDTLWWDEAWTMRFVNGSWLNIITRDHLCNNHIFSTFLIKLCTTILGEKEWVVRIPALSFSFLTIIAIYYLSKFISHNYITAHIITLLTITSYGFVFCATSARGYALVMTFAVVIALLIAFQNNLPENYWISLYVFLGFLSIITLPTAAIIPIAFVTTYATNSIINKGCSIKRTLLVIKGTIIILLLSFIIYAWTLPSRFIYIASKHARYHDIIIFIINNIISYWGGLSGNLYSGIIITIIMFIGFIYILRRNRMVATYLFLIIAGAIIIHIKGGYKSFWYSSMGMVFAPFLLGVSLEMISKLIIVKNKKWIGRTALLLFISILVMGNIYSSSLILKKRSYIREIVSVIKKYQDNTDIDVFVINSNSSLSYYLKRFNIKYHQKEGIDDLDNKDIWKPEVIIAFGLPSTIKDQLKNKTVIDFKGWSESYSIINNHKNSSFVKELNLIRK